MDTFLVAINGAWVMLTICVVFVFARYVIKEWHPYGRARIKAAIAILVHFIGEAGWHSLSWCLHIGLLTTAPPRAIYALFIACGGVAAVGALCCIRIFSPIAEGRVPWIIALVLALVGAMVSFYFVA